LQVKFRGPDFAPLSFMLRTDTYEQLKDSKGRLIPTVIAKYLSDTAQEEIAAAARTDEDQVLQAIKEGAVSFADIAKALGWYTAKNEPNRAKSQRCLGRLKRAKLVAVERGRHVLTEKGKKTTQ
jgi:hypothetical protein